MPSPVKLRVAPPGRPLTALHRSRARRRRGRLVHWDGPADIWRELCWWYLVFPGRDGAGDCDIMFTVDVRHRRPAINSAVVPRPAGHLR